jgi:6-pyruvoyl-tetrahydropterin synthase
MNMYKTGIKDTFRARHKLIGDFGDETVPHEHTYELEWIVSVRTLDENGFGVDIDLMTETLTGLLDDLNGAYLNELPYFNNRQTSVENTACYVLETLFEKLLRSGFDTKAVAESEIKIWESETAWASFEKPNP